MESHTINWPQILLQAGFIVVPILAGGYIGYKRL